MPLQVAENQLSRQGKLTNLKALVTAFPKLHQLNADRDCFDWAGMDEEQRQVLNNKDEFNGPIVNIL